MIKKLLFVTIACSAFSGVAMADDVANGGTINFTGTVVDAPCVIAADSVDMSVDLGQTTIDYLNKYSSSKPVNVNINLTNCALSGAGTDDADITKADVTFNSSAVDTSDKDLLANTDSAGAQGIGVRLLNGDGANVVLGTADEIPLQVSSSEQTLTFQADMENINSVAITPGAVAANATYTIAYK
ncbi:fimbrial protein [Salmonella enterica]|uniref:Fimbrial protein n=4 Tax=Salmonella enterica TaxID=28901 RepID=A0A3U6ZDP7_SALDZ|nr:fimbrial protein [Salmonella enterica]EAA4711711.1 fimbrial protein [Salmonella enterica subsp. diarizonae]EAT5047935.1 fimbrial protein [Salmonella enterica subsp. enterica]EBE3719917.1 fimbrial protein [Salmonella enterica subsp. diarizonae serovar 42:l,v:1,5,7]EBH8061644.1 fimbrial protein [Salmonella bongori]EBH8352157.1 fimbrial protein [Salmonella enterica subsp. diarizonae serovar 61:l,[v],[z13]:1,5,[7]]EBT7756030.1 fimbrial protein [Salmonella enterica subsp. diarizonae serovar 61: